MEMASWNSGRLVQTSTGHHVAPPAVTTDKVHGLPKETCTGSGLGYWGSCGELPPWRPIMEMALRNMAN